MQIVQIECQLSYFIIHEVFLFGTVFLWERFSFSQKFCFGTFFEWYKFNFGTFSESMIGWKWNDSHTLWVTRFSSNHWLGKCAKRKFVSFKKCAKTKFLRNWKSLSQENCAKKKYLVYAIENQKYMPIFETVTERRNYLSGMIKISFISNQDDRNIWRFAFHSHYLFSKFNDILQWFFYVVINDLL